MSGAHGQYHLLNQGDACDTLGTAYRGLVLGRGTLSPGETVVACSFLFTPCF